METDKILDFLKKKKDQIEELRSLNADDKRFTAWYESLRALAERMGETYVTRVSSWDFWVHVVSGWGDVDDSAEEREAYLKGLDEAEASIESMIEELELWGSPHGNSSSSKRPDVKSKNDVTFNLSITQQQAQTISSKINLEQFDPVVQEKIRDLLDELQKGSKNKDKIKGLLTWLANKATDALIALLVAKVS